MSYPAAGVVKRIFLVVLSATWQYGAAAEADPALIEAAQSQDIEAVHTLVKGGKIDINARQGDGTTALAWAVYRDDAGMVRLLIDAGADVNLANELGVTPLYLAAENRNPGIIELLLEAGAEPDKPFWSGETPLMAATATGVPGSVELLLANGADVNAREPRRGQTALMWAISFGFPEIARVLVAHGADINAASIKLKEKEDFTPMLLEGYGADVEGIAQGGYTPLMFAARVGDLATTRLLVDGGADINAVSHADGSPLIIASAGGYEELALYLLEQGADPRQTDDNGMTALHYAMRDGLKLLHGYPLDSETRVCGFGPLSACKPLESLSEEERARINDSGSGLTVKTGASGRSYSAENDAVLPRGNMYELAEALLARGADSDAAMLYPPPRLRLDNLPWLNLEGATPFFLASAAVDVSAMEMLLEHGANPQVSTAINEKVFYIQTQRNADDNQILGNGTSLMVAVGLGRKSDFTPTGERNALAAAKRLVELGSDVNAATATGWTPLHASAFLGADSLVRFLVENGAKIDVQNGCGQTPLSLAEGVEVIGLINRPKPHQSTIKLLMELGAGSGTPGEPVGECVLGRGGLEVDRALKQEVQRFKQQQQGNTEQ